MSKFFQQHDESSSEEEEEISEQKQVTQTKATKKTKTTKKKDEQVWGKFFFGYWGFLDMVFYDFKFYRNFIVAHNILIKK